MDTFQRLLLLVVVAASPFVVQGGPVNQCSPYLWTTVGNHDAPPCWREDMQVLKQLSQIKDLYSGLSSEILSGVHGKALLQHPLLREAAEQIMRWTHLQKADEEPNIVCTGCNAIMETLIHLAGENQTADGDEEVMTKVVTLCTTFKVQSEAVCDGAVHLFGPIIIYLIRNTESNGKELCNFLLENDCGSIITDWNVEVPPKPPVVEPTIPEDVPTIKVLHISDLHFDSQYTEGAVVYCGEPLCCRAGNGMAGEGEDGAGKWGDWRCDTPLITLENMLEHTSTNHPDIAYVVWTGDIPPHDVWEQTRENNLEALHSVAAKVRQYFPDTPVYAAVGNHESSPANNFPSPDLEGEEWSMSWLYDELNTEWSYWLPEDTAQTIKEIASYTALVKEGLRIVSLNMNFCYNNNWWLVLNSTDPGQELRWLVSVLTEAETQGEKVQIIGHIPPGASDCLKPWSDNFYNIVSRFETTVAGMFFGHTHKDGFEIYYDTDNDTRPVSVAYVGPSLTTYTELNPGFRLYQVDAVRDGFSGMVVDHETWVLDLETSNQDGEAHWYKSYSAKDAYKMNSLLPGDWDKLYQQMKTDDDLVQLFNRYKYKEAPNHDQCDEGCKQDILCSIRACRKYGNDS